MSFTFLGALYPILGAYTLNNPMVPCNPHALVTPYLVEVRGDSLTSGWEFGLGVWILPFVTWKRP